jgi:hypothetical protein
MKRFIDTIKNIWKIEELREKILLTLGLLLIYRFVLNLHWLSWLLVQCRAQLARSLAVVVVVVLVPSSLFFLFFLLFLFFFSAWTYQLSC